jgi:hypothetical protein
MGRGSRVEKGCCVLVRESEWVWLLWGVEGRVEGDRSNEKWVCYQLFAKLLHREILPSVILQYPLLSNVGLWAADRDQGMNLMYPKGVGLVF